ncbi:MAG TPA: phosphodiesterase [Methylomirabilota bacterium]|nr:phosphodiesterase [Methylomirabilota bacterium]
MLIAQITDTHISTPGSVNDRHFRTPEHLERAVAHLNRLTPRPDVVLATGDLVERGEPEEYARLRAILDRLAMPLYVIPGNHDSREGLARAFADRGYLPTDGGFLHYTVEEWPVRLIGLDTQVPGQPGGRLCAERLAWLDARLGEAAARPTVVFMHHPPFVTGLQAMDAMGLEGKEELATVIRRHPQVERLVCGHVHRPMTRRFAGTVATTCPATAHQIALELPPTPRLSVVMEPPACMLHLWLGADAGLVSHVSVIGDERPPFTLFDGQRWLREAVPPPAFHPG